MPVKVFGYIPAWGLPDISPYVTKLVFWLKIANIPFEYQNQDLTKLDVDAPFGKLPYILDEEKGNKKVADSNTIIEYLIETRGLKLDSDLSRTDLAVCTAFDRLIGEHLYFSGVLQPRWRMDEGFEVYIPYIVGGAEVGPELRAMLDGFRQRIVDEFNGQGMGRRDESTVFEFYKRDIDAISEFMGSKQYFYGDKPHTIDANVYAILRHLHDQPQKWKGTGYIETKQNLVGYLDRMRKQYNM